MGLDPLVMMAAINSLCVTAYAAAFIYVWLVDRRSIYSYWLLR